MLEYDVSEIKREKAYREISREEYESEDNRLEFFKLHRFYDKKESKYYEMKCELNMLIFICSMFSGIPDVDEFNIDRLAERIEFLECVNKSTYLKTYNPKMKRSENRPFTKEMIREFIGLRTQGQKLTKTQFIIQSTKGWKL